MWVYHILDFIMTLLDAFGLYLVNVHLCKDLRFHSWYWNFFPACVLFVITWITTWYTPFGAYKVFLIAVSAIICLKIIYRDSIYQVIVCYEVCLLLVSYLPELIALPCMQFAYGDAMLIEIEGIRIYRWETYVFTLMIRAFVFIGIYMLIRDWRYRFVGKDALLVSLSFFAALGFNFLSAYQYLNLGILSNPAMYMTAMFLTISFIVSFLYSKNTIYIREQEFKKQQTIERMDRQFSYYREKAEDETRVRALYHDMKNHLLILERQDSPETRQMAAKLRGQISDYEDYIHTGNDFLDVIIRDKAKNAKAQGIDFLAVVDFAAGSFMQPLDISTIFGNALDNAIEASVKLPQEQRMITVKAGCVREMLSVVFENNCLKCDERHGRTTKSDSLLHGFGIENMKVATEKYGGQCLIQQEDGCFIVKIILPLPEKTIDQKL